MNSTISGINSINKGRNLTIDSARVLFTLAVFMGHTNRLIQNHETEPLYMCFGFLGVEFFFILSGYLMAANVEKKKDTEVGAATIKFIFCKFKRIFPYFAIAWSIAMLISNYNVGFTNFFILTIKALPCIFFVNLAGFDAYQILAPTWYISAMLLSELVLYPILIRYRKTFSMSIAPVISIFVYGYLIHTAGNLATISSPEGFYNGLLRGFAGVSLGCICFEASKALSVLHLNTRGGHLFAVIEIIAFGLALFSQKTHGGFRPDFIFLIMVSVGIIAGFCNKNTFTTRFTSSCKYIGNFSLCYYLADRISIVATMKLLPEAARDERLPMAFAIATTIALIIMVGGNFLSSFAKKFVTQLRKWFLETERMDNTPQKSQ